MSHVKKYIALVYSSCYNKIPQAAWFINNRNFFSQLWRLWSLRSRCRYGQCLLRTHLLVHRQQSFSYNLTWQQGWGNLSRASFIRAPSSWLNHPQRAHLQKPSHWGSSFSIWIGARTNIQTMVYMQGQLQANSVSPQCKWRFLDELEIPYKAMNPQLLMSIRGLAL